MSAQAIRIWPTLCSTPPITLTATQLSLSQRLSTIMPTKLSTAPAALYSRLATWPNSSDTSATRSSETPTASFQPSL